MNTPIRLALTMGDPAGIGPEIIVKAAHQMRDLVGQGRIELKVLGSAQALAQAASLLQCDIT
jgi:4-hydroxythreonine-4-phosphate dehydrogenase